MSLYRRRSLWYYPLFQIPLMFLAACLVAASLFWILGLGRPPVAVAIALDLSSSTYGSQFNAPGSVMNQEVEAVKAYLRQNNQVLMSNPNQIQILGFGGVVRSLTGSAFETDRNKLETEFDRELQNPDLPQLVASNTTDLNLAIQKGTEALSSIPEGCRELLLVTDGEAPVSDTVIEEARRRRVRINAVVVGANANAPDLGKAATRTNGIYLPGVVNNLTELFINRFFVNFNTNLKWIVLWLGGAWVALMWMLVMPLDRWIFQGLMKLEMPLAGKLSLFNALFWSVLTPILIWQLWRVFGFLSPISQC